MIVGVAGHVDHGKTALVRALTGIDADRLPEEQKRGLSIDLGFAYLPRPDGSVLGFVDMPGHEKFMRNMLAGATGIDLLLLVVAADDGVMPQTREHLAVAELLGMERGLVAITKCDLVGEESIAALREELAALLAGGSFAGSLLVEVSVREGRGIGELQALLDKAAAAARPPRDGPVRFAIDRSFSLAGAGTVVTGVGVQGAIRVGEALVVSPSGGQVRVRSLHVQNRPGEIAQAGQRSGVALGGRIATSEVGRGDWLLDPALHAATQRIDATLHLLASEDRPLRHWTPIRFHHAAAEVAGRVALLQDEPLEPGARAMVQLVLDESVAAAVNDRFVIRAANGTRTLGGGRLVDLRPPHRRRKQPRRLEQLAAMSIADHGTSLEAQLERWPWFVEREVFMRDRALKSLPAGISHVAAGPYLFGEAIWQRLAVCAIEATSAFHRRHPRLLGPGLKRLREKLDPPLPQRPSSALLDALVAKGKLARDGGVFRLPEHRLGPDRADKELWCRIAPLLDGDARFRPPLLPELAAQLGAREFDLARVLRLKAREGALAEVAEGRFMLHQTMREITDILEEILNASEDGLFAAADLRDRLDNGRKVAIQILEYFDRQQITARRGDLRTLDRGRLARYRESAAG